MTPQTKAQRSESAKKAAATRKRNKLAQEQQRSEHTLQDSLHQVAGDVTAAARSVGGTAEKLAKAASDRVKAERAKRAK